MASIPLRLAALQAHAVYGVNSTTGDLEGEFGKLVTEDTAERCVCGEWVATYRD